MFFLVVSQFQFLRLPLSHFELIFVVVKDRNLASFPECGYPIFSAPLIEKSLFLQCVFLAPLLKSVDSRHMGLLLGSIFFSFMSVFMPTPCCFDD
jgi:hypothetical protein